MLHQKLARIHPAKAVDYLKSVWDSVSRSSLRWVTHLTVIILTGWVLIIGQLPLPAPVREVPTATPAPSLGVRTTNTLTSRGGPRPQVEALIPVPVPHTIIPERPRRDVITYTVQSGDTLSSIAEKFGISADTIMWASKEVEDYPDLLYVGQVLIIPPVDGVYHTVQEGDTLESIAQQYKARVEDIIQCETNRLEPPYELRPGQKIMVPGGVKPYKPIVVHAYSGPIPAGASRGTGSFVWPTTGWITQKFHARHMGIDIGNRIGTPIVAADSGYVVYAGTSQYGYGIYILIDHGNGFQTLYAHLDECYVEAGESVGKGQVIGAMGNTGRSTGPHLHFEIRYRGTHRNPLGYLPRP